MIICIIFDFMMALIFFLFGICGTLSEIKIENLKPFLEFGIEKPLIGSFVNMLMSTAPIYTILIIPKNNPNIIIILIFFSQSLAFSNSLYI